MKELIEKLHQEFWAKPYPSDILKKLGAERLVILEKRYQVDHDALWIGAIISDMFIAEAVKLNKMPIHVDMAVEYAKEIFKIYPQINSLQQEKIIEIIATHHGGEQKYIESKLFKNADCFKFLEPLGVFNFFADVLGRNTEGSIEQRTTKAMNDVLYKIEEKFALVDLDEQTINEAKELYTHWKFLFSKSGIEFVIPDRFKK